MNREPISDITNKSVFNLQPQGIFFFLNVFAMNLAEQQTGQAVSKSNPIESN